MKIFFYGIVRANQYDFCATYCLGVQFWRENLEVEEVDMTHPFDVIVEKDSAGYFVASVPALYIATEVVASGSGVGEAGAQRPEHTQQYVRSASTARPRPGAAYNQ